MNKMDFQYNVGKKYTPDRGNWVVKYKISLSKGAALPPCNHHKGLCPWTPARDQPSGPPMVGQ